VSTVSKKKHPRTRESLAEINARGEYSLVEPLDYMILAQLQDEGTLMGGYYPLADSPAQLRKKHFPELTVTLLTVRLRVMHMQELVKIVNTAGTRSSGWQRTSKGKELVEAWQQQQK
jgi:hypothetical protein